MLLAPERESGTRCWSHHLRASTNNPEAVVPAKMDTIMDIKVLASGGFPWMTAEHQRERKPLRDNDLQTPLDFSGPPQKDAVEREIGNRTHVPSLGSKSSIQTSANDTSSLPSISPSSSLREIAETFSFKDDSYVSNCSNVSALRITPDEGWAT